MNEKFAIIDLGSNSVRVNIMKVHEDYSYRMIDHAKEMVRLSEDMGEDLTLKPPAIKRTLDTLKLFRKLADAHKVDKVFAVATAAVRMASNQGYFLKKIKKETGFKFKVISGNLEAYYGYLGAINTLCIKDCVMVDVGGASTEIVVVRDRQLKAAASLPYGAVLLTERFLETDTIPQEKISTLENFILTKLQQIEWLKANTQLPVVGIGGTIRTFAKIDKRRINYPLEGVHNYKVAASKVLDIYNTVKKMNLKERSRVPGLAKKRADIICGGFAVVKMIMHYVGSNELTISGNGLREGVFFENYFKTLNRPNLIVDNVLKHSLFNVMQNFEMNIEHGLHVRRLALSIFDQIRPHYPDLTEQDKKLLYASSFIHDIGISIDYYNHHKHGFYLTLNSGINGLSKKEHVMVAFIVGLHRGKSLKIDWKDYRLLINERDYKKTNKLSILVGIADGLDRNEFGTVENLQCRVLEDKVIISLETSNTPELEVAAAMKCSKAFKKYFNKKLYIKVKS